MKNYVLLFFACASLIHGETSSVEERLGSLEKEVHRLHLVEKEVQKLRGDMQRLREVERKVERDVKRMQEVDIQYDVRLNKVESRTSICNTTMYSFSTRLHENTEATDSAVIFGMVNLNIGNGYDEFTGVFTAPQSGLYLISVYGSSGGTNMGDSGQVYIKKNDGILCTMRISDGNFKDNALGPDTNGCIAIVELTPEDSVRVTGNSDDPALVMATFGAGFVGHVIQPYCS